MITFLVLILIFSILVFVHELGHFFTAKKFGVRVEEFGFGIPPRLFGRKIGETIYSINLLPFGGFVKLTGEDSEETNVKDPKNFASKKPYQRILILVAGVFMNLLLAVLLYFGFFFINNFKTLALPVFFDYNFKFGKQSSINTVVTAFSPSSSAEKAGVQRGEAVIEINSVAVYGVTDIRKELDGKVGQNVRVMLMDVRKINRDVRSITVTVQKDEKGKGILGVILSKAVVLSYEGDQKRFAGFLHAYNMLAYTVNTIGNMISLSFKNHDISPVSDSVSGPVGIFAVVKAILSFNGKEAVLGLLDLVALLSLSLGFINVLPFPALDGGRIAFVLVEMMSGKRVSPKAEAFIHKVGMVFLLGLIVLVTFKDIKNLI